MSETGDRSAHEAGIGDRMNAGSVVLSFSIRAAAGIILFLAPCSVIAQPAFFEPKEHYYKAKGFAVSVRWEVPQTVVVEGQELTATLVIIGAANPTEIAKPDLKELAPFAARFAITPAADPPRSAEDKEVRFAYRLRPRSRAVDQVPALEFYFFSQAAPPGRNPFRLTRADAIALTVTEPPPLPPVPMVEAERLFEIHTGKDVLRAPFVPCEWAWLAAALFGPLAALAWLAIWRRIYPNAARQRHIRRTRAARRALDAIRRSGRAPDPPAVIAAALLSYLRVRFPLPESAVTPSELEAALTEAAVPRDAAEQVAAVFRAADHARFSPPGDRGTALGVDAAAVITRLEELA